MGAYSWMILAFAMVAGCSHPGLVPANLIYQEYQHVEPSYPAPRPVRFARPRPTGVMVYGSPVGDTTDGSAVVAAEAARRAALAGSRRPGTPVVGTATSGTHGGGNDEAFKAAMARQLVELRGKIFCIENPTDEKCTDTTQPLPTVQGATP